MSAHSHDQNYAGQIKEMEEIISDLMRRVKFMELELKAPDVDEQKRKVAESELREIKKLIDTNKETLSKLHTENTKSFMVAAILFFICFLVYGLYVIFYGA